MTYILAEEKDFSEIDDKENSFNEEILPVNDCTKLATCTINDIPTKDKIGELIKPFSS